jgi:hypothetical protein
LEKKRCPACRIAEKYRLFSTKDRKRGRFFSDRNTTANLENATYCTAADAPFAHAEFAAAETGRARQRVQPLARQLLLIKDAELHDVSSAGRLYLLRQFFRAKG